MIQLHVIWYASKLFISWSFGFKLLGQFGTGNFFWTVLNKAVSAKCRFYMLLTGSFFCFTFLLGWDGVGARLIYSPGWPQILRDPLVSSSCLLTDKQPCQTWTGVPTVLFVPRILISVPTEKSSLDSSRRTDREGKHLESSSQERSWNQFTNWLWGLEKKNGNSNPAFQTSRLVPANSHNLL